MPLHHWLNVLSRWGMSGIMNSLPDGVRRQFSGRIVKQVHKCLIVQCKLNICVGRCIWIFSGRLRKYQQHDLWMSECAIVIFTPGIHCAPHRYLTLTGRGVGTIDFPLEGITYTLLVEWPWLHKGPLTVNVLDSADEAECHLKPSTVACASRVQWVKSVWFSLTTSISGMSRGSGV